MHFDLVALIEAIGYVGLFAIIFFLPGDSVLFTAGFLASQNILSLPILIVTCFTAAVLGDSVGYAFGKRIGPRLFKREDSILFHKKNVVKAQQFYEKYGAKAIVITTLQDQNDLVRQNSIWALGKIGGGEEVIVPIDQQGRSWINYAGPWGQRFFHWYN